VLPGEVPGYIEWSVNRELDESEGKRTIHIFDYEPQKTNIQGYSYGYILAKFGP
jgi:hypothetical protein